MRPSISCGACRMQAGQLMLSDGRVTVTTATQIMTAMTDESDLRMLMV